MRTRMEYLDAEITHLSKVAVKGAYSRGRAHSEPEHPHRSPFERDRDRVIHCSAFRKLEYKTQVFVNHEGDYYRTRLTHTLEASQITRSLARFLRLNEDLAEAVVLVHDVGHPPFGHAGEQALQKLMADHGGFEHNLHGLRVVEELESPYPGFRGLNLTWEVREGIAKHSKSFDPLDPGPAFEAFRGSPWPSLEAQLADVCDEIAYNAHDIDDGLTAGLLKLSDLDEIALWRQLNAPHAAAGLTPHQAKFLGVRALINEQVQDVVRTVEQRIAEWGLDSADAVRTAPGRTATLSVEMAVHNQELRRILGECVYRNHRVYRMSVKAHRIVDALFRSYVEFPRQLPPGVLSEEHGLYRSVCDYLAGMTDREALEEYRRLFDPLATT